jgi:hypothetical protein
MKLRFTTKDENIKPFVCLRHVQMSIKCIFVLNYLFWSLIIQDSMDNQAPKKEHLMKSGISAYIDLFPFADLQSRLSAD